MKNLYVALVAVAAMLVVGFTANEAQAQCGRSFVSVNSGFNSVVVPQAVVVPQSTAFFSGGNVAFVNTPHAFVQQRAFVAQPVVVRQKAFVAQPVVQQVNVRKGLFGRVRRVQVNSFAAPAAVKVNVGRSRVFIR